MYVDMNRLNDFKLDTVMYQLSYHNYRVSNICHVLKNPNTNIYNLHLEWPHIKGNFVTCLHTYAYTCIFCTKIALTLPG